MTRTAVYGAGLVALVAATAMTLTSTIAPNWVSYTLTIPSGDAVRDTIGLYRRCTSSTGKCVPFPDEARCPSTSYPSSPSSPYSSSFCSMWRTAGFLMNFAIVAELAALVGFVIIMAGGKVKRQGGWKILGGGLGAVAGAQFAGVAVVAYLFDNDDFFLVPGYRLDSSWYLCTFSAGVALLAAFGLAISAFVLPPEDGYELLGDSGGV